MNRGAGGSVQFVVDPYVEFGVSAAPGLADKYNNSGVLDAALSETRSSLGGFVNGMGAAVAEWREIGISESCFRKGRSSVLGTLIHELAHLNGAANGTTDAEDALVYCGLGTAWEYVLGIDDPSTVYVPGMRN